MRLCFPSITPSVASGLRLAKSNLAWSGLAMALVVAVPQTPALAQAIVLSVNGDPVTSVDLEQRMKLLRALRKPATREAAVESMISDRLKNREAGRFGVIIKDDEIGEEVQRVAKRMKITPSQLSADISKAGVTQSHAIGHFKSDLGYFILIKALNRGVEASEVAVRQELAKEKGKGSIINYSIRQVVFTLDPADGPAAVNAAAKQAEALRAHFTNCQAGVAYAKTLPGVAVRDALTRSSTQLGDGIKDVLDKTPIGHLTQPSRSPNGIEVIAVCDRSATKDDTELRKTISDRLLAEHFEQEEASKYKEMRSRAVIEKR
jgi:peptidyl-prolyl cis-trans isomerase SurA